MDAQWRLLYRYFSRPAKAYFARATELILKDSRVWLVTENIELSLKADKCARINQRPIFFACLFVLFAHL